MVYVVQVCLQLVSRSIWSCSQTVSKLVWHIPLLCVQWKTPDDGQKNCPKHVEFHCKNKFEKLVHIVGFITSNKFQYHTLPYCYNSRQNIQKMCAPIICSTKSLRSSSSDQNLSSSRIFWAWKGKPRNTSECLQPSLRPKPETGHKIRLPKSNQRVFVYYEVNEWRIWPGRTSLRWSSIPLIFLTYHSVCWLYVNVTSENRRVSRGQRPVSLTSMDITTPLFLG